METNENELEFFEKEKLFYPIIRINRPIGNEDRIKFKKDGRTFYRPARQGLKEGEEEIEKYKARYYSSYGFDKAYSKHLLNWLDEGNLYDPSKKPFKYWDSFKGESLEYDSDKIISFYSTFQIHFLEILKSNYSVKFNLAYEHWNNPKICTMEDLVRNLENKKDNYPYFNLKKTKQQFEKERENFDRILEFLLSIQSIYAPYGRSSSKTITIKDENWHENRNKFNPKKELNELEFTIKQVTILYGLFSDKANKILGIKRDDWIQLWKSIAWNEKNKLEGDIRLGIEYLQWALMIKRFIQDYCDREILDIDEIGNISWDDVLKIDISSERTPKKRKYRNEAYFDSEENKNYYNDKYRRLFYLANDFDLNYQPKIMVFVEGETEEKIFPKIFEWYYNKPENLGIEIINFKGVDKLLSTSQNALELKNLIDNIQKELRERCISHNQRKKMAELIKELKKTDIIISNWTSFVSYNLNKWQIIPFFVSDNEGNVKHFLDAGKPINFKGDNYDIPEEWKYLWGVTNANEPYFGNNFELANFSDEEILLAINEALEDDIDINKIREIRENEDGIKKIDDKILKSRIKIKIVNILFDNLFREFEETNNEKLLERPIFKLIEKIIELARFNPPPVNTEIEIHNKKIILELLNGTRSSIFDN